MLSKCLSLSQMASGHLQKYGEVFLCRWKVGSFVGYLMDKVVKLSFMEHTGQKNCCYQRYKILLPWVPGGEAGEVGGARVTRQQPAVFSFHGKRLNRRWLVKFEQRTGK